MTGASSQLANTVFNASSIFRASGMIGFAALPTFAATMAAVSSQRPATRSIPIPCLAPSQDNGKLHVHSHAIEWQSGHVDFEAAPALTEV